MPMPMAMPMPRCRCRHFQMAQDIVHYILANILLHNVLNHVRNQALEICIDIFQSKLSLAGCPLAKYIIHDILRDIGEHYRQYIVSNYSLILTNIFIFVTTHKI